MVVGRAKAPLVVEEAVVEAVSLAPLVKLSVEVALVGLLDWVEVAWSTVSVRVFWSETLLEALLASWEPMEAAWPVKVDTAAALLVLMALEMGCPPGEARVAVARKMAELMRVNFIVGIWRLG